MRHKITNISEPTNSVEAQKAKDAKSFTRSVFGIFITPFAGMGGMTLLTHVIKSGDFSFIPVAVGIVMLMVSSGLITGKLARHLQELYDRKGNEQQVNNEKDLSGGIER